VDDPLVGNPVMGETSFTSNRGSEFDKPGSGEGLGDELKAKNHLKTKTYGSSP
jgi:hypothetical protein